MARNNFSHNSMGNLMEVRNPTNPGLPGNRNDTTLRAAFSAAPIYAPGANVSIKQQFEDLILEGVLVGEGPKGSGFGFSEFSRDFVDAPVVEGVEKDNRGDTVASPYVPNVASPNAAGQVESIVVPNKPAGGDFVGDGLRDPRSTSEDISSVKIGTFGLGTSSPRA
jgi:hypothetical protein